MTDSLVTLVVILTAYVSHPACTDDTPFLTASGETTSVGTLALSRDLLQEFGGGPFSFGDQVALGTPPFIDLFRVEDTMNARYTRRADVWLPIGRSQAMLFGAHRVLISQTE